MKKRKAFKRVLVEKHIKANPQATMISVAKVTGAALNYVHKINKDLKDIEDHARAVSNLLPLYTEDKHSSKSVAEQAEAIYTRRKDMETVRAQVRKLEEQDRAKQSDLGAGRLDLDKGTLTAPWSTLTMTSSDPDLIGKLPPIGEAVSDGSTASYYVLPTSCTELQHLISHKDMNAQIGEIFRSCYRYGESSHSSKLRDAKKIKFYIDAEIARLEA